MKTVLLYGHLGKKFGKRHQFDVRTPAEAIRALAANFPGFREHVIKNSEPGYHVRVGKETRDETGLAYPIDGVLRIIPAVGGSGAIGRIVLGAALMYLTTGTGALLASWAIGTGSSFVIGAVSALGNIGMSLVLGGVTELLFAPPKAQSTEPASSKPSYAFNGPVNTVTQGNPVPVCYGRMIVGSQVVSASISAVDYPVSA